MTEITENQLLKYHPTQEDVYTIRTPTIPTGQFAEAIYQVFTQAKQERFQGNSNLALRLQDNQLVGSNLFTAVLLDELVRPNFRVAHPEDWDENAEALIKDKFYSDTPAVVLRSTKDSYNPSNNPLAEKLAEHLDIERAERAEIAPALITGLALENADNDYRLKLIPNERFRVHYDERLLGIHNRKKFKNTDELGLPIFDENGDKTWYTRDDGLSRFCMDWSLVRDSGGNGLANSYDDGWVVLVSGEATA